MMIIRVKIDTFSSYMGKLSRFSASRYDARWSGHSSKLSINESPCIFQNHRRQRVGTLADTSSFYFDHTIRCCDGYVIQSTGRDRYVQASTLQYALTYVTTA